jgi:hypothetical protein
VQIGTVFQTRTYIILDEILDCGYGQHEDEWQPLGDWTHRRNGGNGSNDRNDQKVYVGNSPTFTHAVSINSACSPRLGKGKVCSEKFRNKPK